MSISAKPLTNFELETKIRVIIKELLEATSNKLSQFNQRIDGYEKYYFGFGDHILRLQTESKSHRNQIESLKGMLAAHNEKMEMVQRSSVERCQKSGNLFDELQLSFSHAQEVIKSIENTNYKIQNQNTKTKNKFLELGKTIQEYRTEASERVSKFVEDNVRVNVEVKSMFEKISSEVFSSNLNFEQMRKTLDHYIDQFNAQNRFNKDADDRLLALENTLPELVSQKDLKGELVDVRDWVRDKLDSVERIMLLKVEQVLRDHELLKKYDADISELNLRARQVENELERITKNLVERASDNQRKVDLKVEQLGQSLEKQLGGVQKDLSKRIEDARSELRTTKVETTNQLLLFKSQIQTKIYNETTQLKESKQKEKAAVNEEMMRVLEKNRILQREQIIDKIGAVEKGLGDRITEVETKIEDVRLKSARTSRRSSLAGSKAALWALGALGATGLPGAGLDQGEEEIDPMTEEFLIRLEQLEEKASRASMKIEYLENGLAEQKERHTVFAENYEKSINSIELAARDLEQRCSSLLDEHKSLVDRLVREFENLKRAVQEKLQTTSFIVTRIRSDIINRNELETKTIRQLGRKQEHQRKNVVGILKIIPAIGECINLLMSMMFDTEFDASWNKSFLNQPNPNPERFTTLSEGILYEFREKKKQGTIYYRHQQIKKTEILKAHFFAFIEMWDSLQQNEFKEKFELFPKGFYKACIERKLQKMNQNNETIQKLNATQNLPSHSKLNSKPDILQTLLNDNGKSGSVKRRMSTTMKRLNTSFVPTSAESPPKKSIRMMEI